MKHFNKMRKGISIRNILVCLLTFAMLTAMTACDEEETKADEATNIKDVVGTWIEVSVAPRTLAVSEDGTYTLSYEEYVEQKGKVTITYEEHPDGSKTAWYDFTPDGGEIWTSFPTFVEGESKNEMYSGQDGAMHFIREDADMKITAEDYLHVWSSGRCYVTVEKKDKKNYEVSISWSSSASDSIHWTYICQFDKDTSSLVCKKGATCVNVVIDEKGKDKSKTIYKDGSGSFVIKCGTLRWTDDKEDQGKDLYLVREDYSDEEGDQGGEN